MRGCKNSSTQDSLSLHQSVMAVCHARPSGRAAVTRGRARFKSAKPGTKPSPRCHHRAQSFPSPQEPLSPPDGLHLLRDRRTSLHLERRVALQQKRSNFPSRSRFRQLSSHRRHHPSAATMFGLLTVISIKTMSESSLPAPLPRLPSSPRREKAGKETSIRDQRLRKGLRLSFYKRTERRFPSERSRVGSRPPTLLQRRFRRVHPHLLFVLNVFPLPFLSLRRSRRHLPPIWWRCRRSWSSSRPT